MDQSNLPTHEVIYRRIRDMVLFGDLAPGQPVTLHGLTGSLGVSTTPVREAVRRLTAEGALEHRGKRRVGVPVLDGARLDELEYARLAIEPRMAELACKYLTGKDIDALEDIDDALNAAILAGHALDYIRLNHDFHFTLYRHSGAQILLTLADSLWLRFGPLSRVICGRFGTGRMADRHEEAVAALRAGDAAAAGRAIAADIRQGFALMRDGLRGS